MNNPRVPFAGMGSWHLHHTARAMVMHNALAGYWVGNKLMDSVLKPYYRRIWPYHWPYTNFFHMQWNYTIIQLKDRVHWLAFVAYAAWFPNIRCLNMSNYSLGYMFRKGYSDSIALPKGPDFKPMNFRHLLGAEKNMFLRKIRGEIDWENWARYSAHILGVYFGSKHPQDNTPDKVHLHR